MKIFTLFAVMVFMIFVSRVRAQVDWGADIHIGHPSPPPPREVIIERPFPNAVWVPGHYENQGYGYHWKPGWWRRPHYFIPPGRHYGWDHERGWERHERRGWNRDGDHRLGYGRR
jgi:hypothetical protein